MRLNFSLNSSLSISIFETIQSSLSGLSKYSIRFLQSWIYQHEIVNILGLFVFSIFMVLLSYPFRENTLEVSTLKQLRNGNGIRILFVPLCSGFGHLSRCILLEREIKRNNPNAKTLILTGGLSHKVAEKQGIPVFKVPEGAPFGWLNRWFRLAGGGESFENSRMAHGILFSMSIVYTIKSFYRWLKIWRVTRYFKPNLIVADGEFLMLLFCKLHKIPCVFVTNELLPKFPRMVGRNKVKPAQKAIDFGLVKSMGWSRLVIVPDILEAAGPLPKTLREKVVFAGPFLRDCLEDFPDRKTVRHRLGVKDDESLILVTVSGVGAGAELIHTAGGAFKEIKRKLPNVKMVIKYWPALSDREAAKLQFDGLKLVGFVPNLFEYIVASDILVTHSGHTTLMEGARASTSIITIPLSGHEEQENNAKRMAEEGKAMVIYPHELTVERLASAIILLLKDDSRRSKMSETNTYYTLSGTSRAAELILNLAEDGSEN